MIFVKVGPGFIRGCVFLEYTLSFTDVLKSLLPSGPWLLVVLLFIFLVYILPLIHPHTRRYWWVIVIVIHSQILILLALCLSQQGAGWQLTNDTLKIKTSTRITLNLKSLNVGLAENTSLWKPVIRTNGFGSPGLETGWFKLANGKKAIVFQHLSSSKMVVIVNGNDCYVLSHPGVEKLYNALISKGVKSCNL